MVRQKEICDQRRRLIVSVLLFRLNKQNNILAESRSEHLLFFDDEYLTRSSDS